MLIFKSVKICFNDKILIKLKNTSKDSIINT